MAQREVLELINKEGGGTLFDLSQASGRQYSEIWSDIHNLFKKGYIDSALVERQSHTGPQKVRFYKITEEGEKYLSKKMKSITF